MENILVRDVWKYLLRFLSFPEQCILLRVNKSFNVLLSKQEKDLAKKDYLNEQGLEERFLCFHKIAGKEKKDIRHAFVNKVTNRNLLKILETYMSMHWNMKFTDQEYYTIYKRTGRYLQEISANYILNVGAEVDYKNYIQVAPAKFYMAASSDVELQLYTIDHFEKIGKAPSICAWTDLVMQNPTLLENLLKGSMPKSIIRNDRYIVVQAWMEWLKSSTWPNVLLFTCEPCIQCVNLLIRLEYNQISNYTWVKDKYPIPEWIV